MEYLASIFNLLADIGIGIVCFIFIGAYYNIGEYLGNNIMDTRDSIMAWKILWPILLSFIVLLMIFIYAYKTAKTLFLSFIPDSKYRISDIFDGTMQL